MTLTPQLVTKAGLAVTSVVTALVVLNVLTGDQGTAVATAVGAVVSAVLAFAAGYRTDNAEARVAKAQVAEAATDPGDAA
jgi:branched-subunit amino acid transport protein